LPACATWSIELPPHPDATREAELDDFALPSGTAVTTTDAPAIGARPGTLRQIQDRVRAVLGVFANQNLAVFHASDGSGHRLLADFAIQADKRNPALAARLLSAFEHWRRLEAGARQSAQAQLERLAEAGLSSNAGDIVARSLADPMP